MIEFRYDFGEKLDLSKFIKQANHYIDCWYEISYNIYVKDFLITILVKPKKDPFHRINFYIYELNRDAGMSLNKRTLLSALNDTRFSNIEIIIKSYTIYSDVGTIISTNVSDIVVKLCQIIKICHKINSLRAFV